MLIMAKHHYSRFSTQCISNLRDINKQKSFPDSFPSSLQLTRTDYVKMYRPPVCMETLRPVNHFAHAS